MASQYMTPPLQKQNVGRKNSLIDRPSIDEVKLEKSIEQKRLCSGCFASSGPKSSESSKVIAPLFDHILILGPPPNCGPDPKPELLFIFPTVTQGISEDDLKRTVPIFAYPSGLSPHGQEFHKKTVILSHFTFVLNSMDRTIYGVCLHSAINPRRVPFFASEKTLGYPFCFCIFMTNPALGPAMHALTYCALLFARAVDPSPRPSLNPLPTGGVPNRFTVSQSSAKIFSVSKFSMDEPSKSIQSQNVPLSSDAISGETEFYPDAPIAGLQADRGSARWPGTRLPEMWYHECVYLKQFTQQARVPTEYQLTPSMKIAIPPASSEASSLFSYPTLDVLFSSLSVSAITTLYTALLLEHHTIFTSSSLQKLTFSVIAARALIPPFKTGATVLPILPNREETLAILESPVPFVIGVVKGTILPPLNQFCLVDLDAGTISDPQLLVVLPRSLELQEKLENILSTHSEDILVPPAKSRVLLRVVPNPELHKFLERISLWSRPAETVNETPELRYIFPPVVADKILKCFQTHLVPSLETLLNPCFITDSTDMQNPVTIFNTDLFLEHVLPSERPFYADFISTQMFQEFCDGKSDELDTIKRLAGGLLGSTRQLRGVAQTSSMSSLEPRTLIENIPGHLSSEYVY